MAIADRPRVVVATPGDPLDPGTWSGSAAFLVRALERAGVLAGAIDGSSRALDRVEQLASFSPDRTRWRQRFHSRSSLASPLLRSARSRVARRRLATEADVVLHVGAWAELPGRVRGSYHDGNLALSLAREEPLLDPRSRSVRRALEADRRFYDRMDVLLPMSEWLRRSFVADFGQSPEKVVTVGAGANLHEVPELPERDYESPRILFVGKQWERKGGPQLLEAFRLVRAERPDAELWVVGPEQAPAAEAGSAVPRPHLTRDAGRRATPRRGLRGRDHVRDALAVRAVRDRLPGGDGLRPRPASRATAARCRRSSTTAPPATSSPHGTWSGWRERLLDLADPERARAFGEAGRRRFLERFTWDAVAARIVEALVSRSAR